MCVLRMYNNFYLKKNLKNLKNIENFSFTKKIFSKIDNLIWYTQLYIYIYICVCVILTNYK